MQNGSVEFRILSHTRGRLRLRILGSRQHRRQAVEALARILSERDDITSFHVNAATGSVTIYSETQAEPPDVRVMLAAAGVRSETPVGRLLERLEPAGISDTAREILDLARQLDAVLSRSMGRRLDLKAAIPLVLLGLAGWKIATQGLGWKQIPAYQLLWYAYSTFRELNVEYALSSAIDTLENGE